MLTLEEHISKYGEDVDKNNGKEEGEQDWPKIPV